MDHPAFKNQDLLDQLSAEQLMELSNLKEMKRSLAATIDYLEQREGVIFADARGRSSDGQGVGQ